MSVSCNESIVFFRDYMDRFQDEQENPTVPQRERSSSPNIHSLLYGDPKRHGHADLKPTSEDIAAALEMVQKVVDSTPPGEFSQLKLNSDSSMHPTTSSPSHGLESLPPHTSAGFTPISGMEANGEAASSSADMTHQRPQAASSTVKRPAPSSSGEAHGSAAKVPRMDSTGEGPAVAATSPRVHTGAGLDTSSHSDCHSSTSVPSLPSRSTALPQQANVVVASTAAASSSCRKNDLTSSSTASSVSSSSSSPAQQPASSPTSSYSPTGSSVDRAQALTPSAKTHQTSTKVELCEHHQDKVQAHQSDNNTSPRKSSTVTASSIGDPVAVSISSSLGKDSSTGVASAVAIAEPIA